MASEATTYERKRKTACTQMTKKLLGFDRLFDPLIDSATRHSLAQNNQRLNTSVERILLNHNAPQQHVLRHYLRLVALVIESDLRNRTQTARPGSVCNDMRVPIELDGEVERRVDQQLVQRDSLTDREKRFMPPATQHEVDAVADGWRTLRTFQLLANLLSDRACEVFIDDTDSAIAVFFSTAHVSRVLQSVISSQRSLLRLPDHRPLSQESTRLLFPFLRVTTESYRRFEIFTDEYVDRLRRFVFYGTHHPMPISFPAAPAAPPPPTPPPKTKYKNEDDDNDDDDDDDEWK
jgi:hypothetical protein